MKTKEELNVLKEEVETLSKKLAELTAEELKQVSGGIASPVIRWGNPDKESPIYEYDPVPYMTGKVKE